MEAILLGASLGLAAGLSPGPMLTLVVASTLQRGFGAGARVALAPLVTETPMILVCLLLVRSVSVTAQTILGVVGGVVVVVLAWKLWRESRRARLLTESAGGDSRDLWRGAVTNALNPNAWLFWVAVGGPYFARRWPTEPTAAVGFVVAFVAMLVGSKLAVAATLARGRHLLSDRLYRWTIAGCSLLLAALGGSLVAQGVTALAAR